MKKCFVVSPIGTDGTSIRRQANNVLNSLIRPVCSSLEYEVIRIDELAGSNSIPDEIFSHLNGDDLVVVDITGLNPNVMLELGYRMKVAKPYVIIRDNTDTNRTPFDIASIRYHNYDLFPDELNKSIAVLTKAIVSSEQGYNPNIASLGLGSYLRKEENGSISLCVSKDEQ